MQTRLVPLIPFFVLLGVACSDTTGDGGGSPSTGGSGSIAGSGGGSTVAGSAALAGAGNNATGGAGATAGGSTAGGSGPGGSASSGGSLQGNSGSPAGGASGGGGSAPLDGKGLYDANCKACHGEQGVGGLLAPEIVHPVRDYSTWVVRNGRAQTSFPKPMEKWDSSMLSDAQLMLIYDYLDLPPQPTTGKALYEDYCASCHGADGKGGPTMRPLINEAKEVLEMVRAGHNVGKFAMRRDYMPAFPASDISDAELALIRDYVDSL